MRAQGALEYLIIIAAVLGISAVVVLFVTSVFTGSTPAASISLCRLAASNCGIKMATGVSTSCPECSKSCVDPKNNQEIFIGAKMLCEQGKTSEIAAEGSYTPPLVPNSLSFEKTIYAAVMMNPISGVLATDGSKVFVKRWGGSTPGFGNLTVVGSGRGGTVKGQNYGTTPTQGINPWSSSVTYHGDGFLYIPFNSTIVRKVNPSTWSYTTIVLPAADNLTSRDSGMIRVSTWYNSDILITSNSTHIFNIAYSINGGGRNGYTIKIYDPAAGFALVKQVNIVTPSVELRGLFAVGKYVYGIQWCDCNTAQIIQMDTDTGTIVGTTTINQGDTKAVNGQYDWVNNRVLLSSWGDVSMIYEYSLPVSAASLLDSYSTTLISGGGAGSLTTDGTYLYVRRYNSYHGAMNYTKIGTGFGGTVAGQFYGTFPYRSSWENSVTYHSDGYLYNVMWGNPNSLERIDKNTGAITTVSVPSGLIRYDTGTVAASGRYLITSDGRYVYNVACNLDCTNCRNGYRVKIFDPSNGWSVVKQFDYPCAVGKLGCRADNGLSYWLPNPTFYAAGRNVYIVAWYDGLRMFQLDTDTGQVVSEWQAPSGAISAAYDWTNDRVYMGELDWPWIYQYKGH